MSTDRYEAEDATPAGSWTPDGPFGGSSGIYEISATVNSTLTFAITVPAGETATLTVGHLGKVGVHLGVSVDGGTETDLTLAGTNFSANAQAVPGVVVPDGAHSIVLRQMSGVGNDVRIDYLDVTHVVTVPATPTDVTADAGDAQATISWTTPASGGSPITGYTITSSLGDIVTVGGGATSAVVPGLTNGTSYTFTVVATNAIGDSDPGGPSSIIIPTPRPNATKLLWVYDLLDEQTMAIDSMLDFEIDDRLQDSEILRFTIAADDPKADYVLQDALVRYRQLSGAAQRFWRITRREPGRDGTRAVIVVEAEARWTELAGRIIPGRFLLANELPDDGLDLILLHRDYGWTVGTVDAPAFAWYGIDETDGSILQMLRDWAKDTGCELVFDTAAKTVSLIPSQGQTRDLGFRYGWNLQGITRRETPPACTVLYAYGRNGLTIRAINPNGTEHIEDFSYYIAQGLTEEQARDRFTREQVWKDDTFISDGPLYDAALARLTELAQPVAAYEGRVIDLRGAGQPVDVGIGDTVPVRDTTLGIALRTRVVRYVQRPLRPHDNEIELAWLQGRPDDSTSSRAPTNGDEWLLFLTVSSADRVIDANLAILADLGLQFSQGGAVHHLDATGTASGTGTLEVTFYDETINEIVGPVIDIVFADGDLIHIPSPWSLDGLNGNHLFSVRVKVITGSGTVAFAAGDVRYSILAQALGVSVPPDDNSVTFTYTGSVQTWEVPPDVTSAVIDCYGAAGGAFGESAAQGARIRARIPVIAGETLNVYVGEQPSSPTGGWNGGGDGSGLYTAPGAGGGGPSDVRRGTTLADRLIVAGAGGGSGGSGSGAFPRKKGGDAGYPDGVAGEPSDATAGQGGTQSAGGAGGVSGGSPSGTDGALGDGGDGGPRPGGFGLGVGGGGGGGGLYGGGGGASNTSSWPPAGGGGSSGTPTQDELIDGRPSTATELFVDNGVNSGHGKVIISWDTP